ncbi:phosphatase PAP2 family protein [Rheinheimera sp.]|uniref:phosphatase PAP2 family protein n=1 Tax=Rheinheimera sp. TaxID=1869214 RepID=UPI0027BB12E7|nr:phosphatase PAP2 family protein [Rheinheimera sp.]
MNTVNHSRFYARLLKSIHQADLCLLGKTQGIKDIQGFVPCCRYISISADGPLYVLLGLFLLYLEHYDIVKLVVVAFIIERVIYFSTKNICRRDRPADCIEGFCCTVVPQDKFSFPSGHTSAAFLIAGTLGVWYPWALPVLYGWALWVALSRVVLGVHFPSDTVAGAALGASVAALVL